MLSLLLATWVALVNTDRAGAGLAPLQLAPELVSTAQWRADGLATTAPAALSHTLPTGGPFSDALLASGIGFQLAGENLGRCVCPVEAIELALLASPAHRANLLEPAYTRVGLGIAEDPQGRTCYVQLFAD